MTAWITSELVSWIPVSLFLIGPWAQIIRNWQAQSTQGVSYRSVFLIVSGLSCTVLYNNFMHMPLAYRTMHPLILATWLVVAMQEYCYGKDKKIHRNMKIGYSMLAGLFVSVLMWGQTYPLRAGMAMGWTLAFLLAIFQIPQVLKNIRRKSVEGLSFTYLSILALGSTIELCVAYWKLLPLQSVLNAVRGICFYVIFVYQFVLYAKKRKGDA